MTEKGNLIFNFLETSVPRVDAIYLGIANESHKTGEDGITYTSNSSFADELRAEGRLNVFTSEEKVINLYDEFKNEPHKNYWDPRKYKDKYVTLEKKIKYEELSKRYKAEIKKFRTHLQKDDKVTLIIIFDNQEKLKSKLDKELIKMREIGNLK